MLSGTNLKYTKAFNFRIVFETIRLLGPISRADIARKTNLTPQTVSNIVHRLIQKSLILSADKLQKRRGAPSTNLILNPNGAYSIGIDFNRDHLTGMLVDLEGKVISKYFYEVDNPEPYRAVQLISDTVNLLKGVQIDQKSYFAGVGISLPGPLSINENNQVVNTINPKAFPNWHNVPIVTLLQQKIDSSIFLKNNASAAAIGELWYGAGKNQNDFLYLFMGAGLGGGVVIAGSVFEGANRNAGELGYFPFINDVSPLSTSDVPHIGEHFNLSNLYSWLNISGIMIKRPEDLENLYLKGNNKLSEWIDLAKTYLTPVLLSAEYLLDFDTVILGGRLPEVIIKHFALDLPDLLSKDRVDMKSVAPKVIVGTAGPDAAALGAATLPVFDLFSVQKDILLKN